MESKTEPPIDPLQSDSLNIGTSPVENKSLVQASTNSFDIEKVFIDKETQSLYIRSKIARGIVVNQCLVYLKLIRDLNVEKFNNSKIGIIGAGNVGAALIIQCLNSSKIIIEICKSENIYVSTRQPNNLQFLIQKFGFTAIFDNDIIMKQCSIIFICVKAHQFDSICSDVRKIVSLRTSSNDCPFIISSINGITLQKLKSFFTSSTVLLPTYIVKSIEFRNYY